MEITTQFKEDVWQRQKGMCGICGQKLEDSNGNTDNYDFKNFSNTGLDGLASHWILLCKLCNHNSGNNDSTYFNSKKYLYPYANFEDYPMDTATDEINADFQNCLSAVAASVDLRIARNILKEAVQVFKTVNILGERRELLQNLLNSANDDLNRRQLEEFEKFEHEANSNFEQIKSKLDEIATGVEETKDFKQLRENIIGVKNSLNEYKLKREQREDIILTINKIFERLNKRQSEEWEKYEMECSENFFNLKKVVEEAVEICDTTTNFKQARENLIAIQGKIKELKLKKDQREELFGKIRNCFDVLNKRQSENREEYEAECTQNYDKLKTMIDEAVVFATNMTNFKQSRDALISAQSAIKGVRLKKDQREELFNKIRETFDVLNKQQSEERDEYEKECDENFAKLSEKVQEAFDNVAKSSDFTQIRDQLIAIQSEVKILKLKKNQRNDLFAKIREAFDSFDRKRKDYRDKVKTEKQSKFEAIITNLENKILRIDESIIRDKEALEQQTAKLAEVRTGDKEEEIKTEINEKITAIQERITDKQKTIVETRNRIDDIGNEMKKL